MDNPLTRKIKTRIHCYWNQTSIIIASRLDIKDAAAGGEATRPGKGVRLYDHSHKAERKASPTLTRPRQVSHQGQSYLDAWSAGHAQTVPPASAPTLSDPIHLTRRIWRRATLHDLGRVYIYLQPTPSAHCPQPPFKLTT